MLVLSRQRDESVMIGDDIEVTIVDIRGDKVRLGTTAPRSIEVHRKEIYIASRKEMPESERLKRIPRKWIHVNEDLPKGYEDLVWAACPSPHRTQWVIHEAVCINRKWYKDGYYSKEIPPLNVFFWQPIKVEPPPLYLMQHEPV